MHSNGYYLIATKIGGRKGINKTFKVHRLVAEAFLDEPDEEIVKSIENTVYGVILVNHKDGNKINNVPSNLEWCSYQQNSIHARENGFFDVSKVTGANNSASFFKTELDRKDAYDAFISSGLSMRKYAKTLGVTHSVVRLLVRDYAN